MVFLANADAADDEDEDEELEDVDDEYFDEED